MCEPPDSQNESALLVRDSPSDLSAQNARRKVLARWLLALVVGVFAVAGFGITLLGTINSSLGATSTPQPEAEILAVMDSFMRAMKNRNIAEASRYGGIPYIDDIAKGSWYVLFEDYESLRLTSVKVCPTTECVMSPSTSNFASDNPSANAAATIIYTGGFTGTFQANLWQVDDKWKISTYNMGVTQEKWESFLEKHPEIIVTPVEAVLDELLRYLTATPTP